jgi:hypothetical protein
MNRNDAGSILRKIVYATTVALALMSSARAEYLGTAQQQSACRPDVFRLCAAEIPSTGRIVACLRAKMSRLSPSCRSVFTGDASEQTMPARAPLR